ncbi:MAG TPA: hypothetical protein VGI81_20955 [Tepidisphaeraceae bacterium]|jgi:hypothetical protein
MLKHEPAGTGVDVEPAAGRTGVIQFNPDRIVQAICFHLLDDHHATRISALSIHHMRDRLRRQKVLIMIARRQWEGFSNKERLEWLLGKSHITTTYSGDVASLGPQK